MRFTISCAVTVVTLLLCSATVAWAEKRVALVIGNAAYTNVERLKNPANDATQIAAKLKSMGFNDVTLKLDLDFAALRRTLAGFARDAAGADIALVYFAGHGIEVAGANYVIPVDAKLAHVDDVDFEAIPLDTVMRSLNRAKSLKLVILDACRNNPFRSDMSGIGANRSVGRGLARVSPPGGDTLVAYAAKENTVADDGDGEHSPYAAALIRHIATPGLDVRLLFGRVRDDVLRTTGGRQEPFTYGSLPGKELMLAKGDANSTKPGLSPGNAQPTIDREALFWSSVKDSNDPKLFEAYLKAYPSGQFALLAKAKLEAGNTRKPRYSPDSFAGLWININKETPGITRAKVKRRVNNLFLQLWGRCHPKDCDWGQLKIAARDVRDGTMDAVWRTSFSVKTQKLILESRSELRIETHVHFTDKSGRPDYKSVDYFKRK